MSSEQENKADFSGQKAEKALEHALDIRKFEISLYWQRAAYFWALIAVTFAGYFAILSADHLSNKDYLAYIVGCIGILFTWAWFLVNRGSKFWQENWENSGWPISGQVEDLARRYSAVFPALNPYGSNSTGCSIATFANTPDNTLPIVHYRSNEAAWQPLFPRVFRD